MEEGDFVYIEYTGRIKGNGVFDTTSEDVAKKEGIYRDNIKYGPVPVVIGGGFLIKGLDETLKKMEVGESRKIVLEPKDAFGEVNENLIKTVPEAAFRGSDIAPEVGKYVVIRGLRGKIVKVDGGRVVIDFNHPLAGKTIEYEIKIISKVEGIKEKAKAIVHYFTGIKDPLVKHGENVIEIETKPLDHRLKEVISREIMKWMENIKVVKFVESFSRK